MRLVLPTSTGKETSTMVDGPEKTEAPSAPKAEKSQGQTNEQGTPAPASDQTDQDYRYTDWALI